MILVVNLVSHNEPLMRRALASGRAAQLSIRRISNIILVSVS